VLRVLAIASGLVLPGWAGAADFFSIRDENPLLRGLYMPLPATREHSAYSWSATLALTNTINVESRAAEQLFVDGESVELRLIGAGSVATDWQYRIVIPIIRDSGGSLDHTIEGWHRFFGLPQGARPLYPTGQLRYFYSRGGAPIMSRVQPATGLGDIDLEAGWAPAMNGTWQLSIWTGLEAPTGSASKQTGNGAWDAALWVNAAWSHARWHLAAEIGVARPFGDDLFAGDATRGTAFQRIAATWSANERWSLRAQLDAHSSRVAHTELRFLERSLAAALGAALTTKHGHVVEFGFAEDAAVNTAPDVSFFVSWRD
jgi:Protein of unknown function (DUF3187)